MYPLEERHSKLFQINDLKKNFNCPIGHSDHTAGTLIPPLAVAAGAQIIEKHFTISPKYRLSDNFFSVTEDQVKKIKLDLEWAHHVTYSPSFNKSDPEKFMRNFKKIISHMFIAFRCTSGGNHGWGNINRLLLIYFLKKKINFKYIFW